MELDLGIQIDASQFNSVNARLLFMKNDATANPDNTLWAEDSPLFHPNELKSIDMLVILQFGVMMGPNGSTESGRQSGSRRNADNGYRSITNGNRDIGSGADRVVAAVRAQKIGLLSVGQYDTTIPSGKDEINGTSVDWSKAMWLDLEKKGYQGPFIHNRFTKQSHNTDEENQIILGLVARYGKRTIAVEIDRRQKDRWALDFTLLNFSVDQPSDFALNNYKHWLKLITEDNVEWKTLRDDQFVHQLTTHIESLCKQNILSDTQTAEQLFQLHLLHAVAQDPVQYYRTTIEELQRLSQQLKANTPQWNHGIITPEEISNIPAETVIKPVLAEDIFATPVKGHAAHHHMENQLQKIPEIQRTMVMSKGGALEMMAGLYYANYETRIEYLHKMLSANGKRISIV